MFRKISISEPYRPQVQWLAIGAIIATALVILALSFHPWY